MNNEGIMRIFCVCLIVLGTIACNSSRSSSTSIAIDYGVEHPVTVHRVASGSEGVVVSGNSEATVAGIRILKQGGNAADAGAATLMALSVTTVGAFCIGGEVPILV